MLACVVLLRRNVAVLYVHLLQVVCAFVYIVERKVLPDYGRTCEEGVDLTNGRRSGLISHLIVMHHMHPWNSALGEGEDGIKRRNTSQTSRMS